MDKMPSQKFYKSNTVLKFVEKQIVIHRIGITLPEKDSQSYFDIKSVYYIIYMFFLSILCRHYVLKYLTMI